LVNDSRFAIEVVLGYRLDALDVSLLLQVLLNEVLELERSVVQTLNEVFAEDIFEVALLVKLIILELLKLSKQASPETDQEITLKWLVLEYRD
jgi:hypothetical protein